MGCNKSDQISIHFAIGQCISIGCAFAGSMFSVYDYWNPNSRQPEFVSDYLWIFGFSAMATTIGGYTAYKFQGINMDSDSLEHRTRLQYAADLAPRNWKSNLAESTYYVFSNLLILVYNYFFVSAIMAAYDAFTDPEGSYPMVPPNLLGWICLCLKTVLADSLFKTTNEFFQAMEDIKQEITGSKKAALSTKIVKPLTHKLLFKPTLLWIQTVGVLSAAITNYVGMLLSIPPHLLISLYNQHLFIFATLITITTIVSFPTLIVIANKLLYFEAKISEETLKELKNEGSIYAATPLIRPQEKRTNLLRKVLERFPKLKRPIHRGFYAQGVIRGGADILPVVLFIRDFSHRHGWEGGFPTATIVVLSLYVFITSAVGIISSDIKYARRNYAREFRYIDPDDEHWRFNLEHRTHSSGH